MTCLEALYREAERDKIGVIAVPMRHIPAAAISDRKKCVILLDPAATCGTADEKVKLAHELGHCRTCSFYSRGDPPDVKSRAEERARRWAFRRLLPFDRLRAAARNAHGLWALSEQLELTEDFVAAAIDYYEKRGKSLRTEEICLNNTKKS